MKQIIKVLVVDDHSLMREVTKRRLEVEDDIMVIAEASDGVEAVNLAREVAPDVILMDVNMPNMDGISATKKIIANNKQAIIIGLSTKNKEQFGKIMRQAGAVAYHSKNDSFNIVCQTIRNKTLTNGVFKPLDLNEFLRTLKYLFISYKRKLSLKCMFR